MTPADPPAPMPPAVMRPLDFRRQDEATMLATSTHLREVMRTRRSVRSFATDPVPRELVEAALEVAASAPSGAHRQPWTFVVVADPEERRRIREAAEEEERAFYADRAPEEWLRALAPLGTDDVKTHLTDAPWLIVMLRHRWTVQPDGSRSKNYYSSESCGIAAGFLIAALHQMGLATLPHTPSPMGFLTEILQRPEHEQPYLVLPVGYPAPDAVVPDIDRKPLDEVVVWR
ncbi:nitroreductase family protein [Euzebya rosea]|uniref:nitroreductase family protein n=1 Tax=Euzebya rosea TaxID=2052804 RepID=UPI000D3E1A56|nr:nitroreductase family protein [Euzebya rosea]